MKTKLLIPVILTTVMMIGATFAVTPVQKASTVHTTILAAINNALGTGTGASGNGLLNRDVNQTAGITTARNVQITPTNTNVTSTITATTPFTVIVSASARQTATGTIAGCQGTVFIDNPSKVTIATSGNLTQPLVGANVGAAFTTQVGAVGGNSVLVKVNLGSTGTPGCRTIAAGQAVLISITLIANGGNSPVVAGSISTFV